MSQIPPDQNLAHYVARCAQRSIYLLAGLRSALTDLQRPDLVSVLDLVAQDASSSRAACQEALATRRKAKRLRILVGLTHLSRMGGPRAKTLVSRLVADMDSPSGAFQALP